MKAIIEVRRGEPVHNDAKWIGEKIKRETPSEGGYREVIYDIWESPVDVKVKNRDRRLIDSDKLISYIFCNHYHEDTLIEKIKSGEFD